MNTKTKILSFIAAAIFLVSCGPTLSVSSDYNKGTDFSKYKTFNFYQLTLKGTGISQLNQNRIINAVTAEMVKKGFVETSSNPDLLVNVTAILKEKTALQADTYNTGGFYRPYGWGGGYGGTTTVTSYNYKDGSLIIDVLDASKNLLIWQGIGNKEIDKPSSNPDQAITSAVTKIMAGYPPGAGKK